MDYGTKMGIILHPIETHTGESEIVGAERGTGGEDTHTTVATQTRGTDGETLGGGFVTVL
jgi:hypothetical protein